MKYQLLLLEQDYLSLPTKMKNPVISADQLPHLDYELIEYQLNTFLMKGCWISLPNKTALLKTNFDISSAVPYLEFLNIPFEFYVYDEKRKKTDKRVFNPKASLARTMQILKGRVDVEKEQKGLKFEDNLDYEKAYILLKDYCENKLGLTREAVDSIEHQVRSLS